MGHSFNAEGTFNFTAQQISGTGTKSVTDGVFKGKILM